MRKRGADLFPGMDAPKSPCTSGWRAARRLVVALAAFCTLVLAAGPAFALKAVNLTGEEQQINVLSIGNTYTGSSDTLQIETAPSIDGATARMAVRASHPGTKPNWITFALHNATNKNIELWLTANRYSPIGSNVIWPDLDSQRITAVAHSSGFAPERIRNDRVDIWRLTIEPGQTITYAAEIMSERIPRTELWNPIEFEQRQREHQLFNGIMLGITGILAVFLTAVFAANHKSIFPTAALVAWCILALLCVDFGFWHKLFQMKPEDNAQYRAVAEAAVAASIVIFLAAFLRVSLWNGFARTLFVVWITAQLAIIGLAILDPRLAATVARLSFLVIGVLGMGLILLLAFRGLDRALALMPTWILFLVWLFGASLTLTGKLDGDYAVYGMVSGFVLILVLIGFTVTQYAFRSTDLVFGAGAGSQQMRLAALDRAAAAFWEWDVRRDDFVVDPDIETSLGLAAGELPTRVNDLLGYLHPADRERFRLELQKIKEHDGGALNASVRVRHADSSYRWLEFEGASVPTSDQRNIHCVGLVRDTTDVKCAQERLLNNAVYDSLTMLPNRELFLDRLSTAMKAAADRRPEHQVVVMLVDVDQFRTINASFGMVVGDSIILTVAKRLSRIVGPVGTLARIGGDQFAIMLVGVADPKDMAAFAERVRLSLRSPMRIAGEQIDLTGSTGIALFDGSTPDSRELLREAEIAMHRAKRSSSDRAEIFTPEMQTDRQERADLEREMEKALSQRQFKVVYSPIVALANDELVGFDAALRWQHPRPGTLSPADFLPVASDSDLVSRIGAYVVAQASKDLHRWQQELARPERPLFMAINISNRKLLSSDLIQEVRHIRSREVLQAGSLKFAVAEQLVMENPEQATQVLEAVRECGIDLWLDGYGTGYSSITYLARLPFDAFRLDRSLVEWSAQGEQNQAVVRSLVASAQELDRGVVAQGVITAENATFLRSIGCRLAQGFHYGELMSEDEVLRLLRLVRKSERRMRRRGLIRVQEKRKNAEAAQAEQAKAAAAPADNASAPVTAPPSSPSNGQQAPPQPRRAPNGNGMPPTSPATRPPQQSQTQPPPFRQPPNSAGPGQGAPATASRMAQPPVPRSAPAQPAGGQGLGLPGARSAGARPDAPPQPTASPAGRAGPGSPHDATAPFTSGRPGTHPGAQQATPPSSR
ncbi:MAG: EAL domain-containing protein, partial [Hyphomicrobiaceae bacterium]